MSTRKHSHNQPHEFELTCFYAQLEHILSYELVPDQVFHGSPLRRLFAVVRNCSTNGLDAIIQPVTYTTMAPSSTITQLTAISCAIRRVKIGTGRRWGSSIAVTAPFVRYLLKMRYKDLEFECIMNKNKLYVDKYM